LNRGVFPAALTVGLSVGVYYVWSIYLQKNDNIGIALGVLTSILVSAYFNRLRKR